MKGLENQTYLIAYIISNILAIILVLTALQWPRISRLLFILLFAGACWLNWNTSQHTPKVYLSYADLTFSELYKETILGWFSGYIQLAVGVIATAQGVIAVCLLLKGRIYKLGLAGGILFLVSIAPLGVGSAFPCTLVMAAAIVVLWKQDDFLWRSSNLRHLGVSH